MTALTEVCSRLQSMSETQLGISDTPVRLSVGVEDLHTDSAQALAKV